MVYNSVGDMMQNIPLFTCAAGVATLILREIPAFGRAYILPRSVFGSEQALLRECADFCRAAGAQFSCEIWELSLPLQRLPRPERPLCLTPVTGENAQDYRALYNRCFAGVDNAAWCSPADAQALAGRGAWLCCEDGRALGLGQAVDGELRAIASERRGLGFDLACALLATLGTPQAKLQVASSNARALRLYERLGFEKTGTRSRWYRLV